MTSPQSPQIQNVAIADIDARNRLRPVSAAGVESLKASIAELGAMKDPIHLRRKGRGEKTRLILMAGGHRLQAARELGWEAVPARIWVDVSDDWAALMEIDDNLSGSDLSTLELAVFLAKRDEVYKRLHPESRAGKAGAAARWDAADIVSFASSVSEKREISERHVRRLVAAGQRLSARDVGELAQAKTAPTLKDLLSLAKIEEDHVRVDVIDCLKHGTAKSVSAALKSMRAAPGQTADLTGQATQRLIDAWKRTPKPAQNRFVAAMFDELYPMIIALHASQREAAE